MTVRRATLLFVTAALALFGFHLFVCHVSLIAFNFAGANDVRALLESSSNDQKRLSRLDPSHECCIRRPYRSCRLASISLAARITQCLRCYPARESRRAA